MILNKSLWNLHKGYNFDHKFMFQLNNLIKLCRRTKKNRLF